MRHSKKLEDMILLRCTTSCIRVLFIYSISLHHVFAVPKTNFYIDQEDMSIVIIVPTKHLLNTFFLAGDKQLQVINKPPINS